MSNYDLDELNAAFSDLRSGAAPFVTPPGMASARATVARRHRNRVTALAVAIVAAIVIPITAFATAPKTPPAVTPTPDVSASAEPSTSPSAAPVTAPSSTATSSGLDKSTMAYIPIWGIPLLGGVSVELPRAQSFDMPIGVEVFSEGSAKIGPATNVVLTIDISKILSKVDVTAVTGPCAINGNQVRCDYGTLNKGTHSDHLTLRAKPGFTGSVGKVKLKVTGNEPSWMVQDMDGIVNISQFYDNMADLVWSQSGSPSSLQVGQTFTRTLNARNNGPSVEPYIEYVVDTPGVELVSAQGCVVTDNHCRVENIAAGTTSVVKLQLRIADCSGDGMTLNTNGMYAIGDPIIAGSYFNSYVLNITGC